MLQRSDMHAWAEQLESRGSFVEPVVMSSVYAAIDRTVSDPGAFTVESKRQMNRLMIRLINGSPKAIAWAQAFHRGQVSWGYLLEMADRCKR